MINKTITLTEKGRSAGPDYSVFYSTDCTNYTLANASVSLPNIGSTAVVSVADNTLCIKLVNLSPTCNDNDVIIDLRNTTTTTTTLRPSNYDICKCLEYDFVPGSGTQTVTNVLRCGTLTSGSISISSNTAICIVSQSAPYVGITGVGSEIILIGTCTTGSCTTTTTTTTQAPVTTTTTQNPAFTTTTTYAPGTFVRVVAHQCQDFYDFQTYLVSSTPQPAIDNVYKDAYGQCYYVTSIPTGTGPNVGTLTYVGGAGSCSSSACVTTTTTAAPYCNLWQVQNSFGFGQYFKYQYCGQQQYTYLEVPASTTLTVCTQNDRIYNSFSSSLTFTNLSTSCIGTTTTTTLAPQLQRVVAHNCQDFYDFGTYGVNKNLHPSSSIGEVFKDSTGTCYYVTSVPSDQTLPVIGTLAFVGGTGACTSSQCVTTTTTIAPFCTNWKVENDSGFGQNFKYQYCGQTNYLYPEVAAYSSVTVCVQNNRIFNSFSSSMEFTPLNTECNATTTTTTTQGPVVKFTAANCQDIYDFQVYQAASASYSLGDVFKDSYGTCYNILSFNGTVAVGTLTYVGPAGSCNSSSCVTTTTTAAPYCNTWKVENSFGAAYSFKYKYCGAADYSYPEVPANSTASFCVQNDEIYNAFGAPLYFTNLSSSCNATTTTSTTTTTTTLPSGCFTYNVVNNGAGTAYYDYQYCDGTYNHIQLAGNGTSSSVCVLNHNISSSYAGFSFTFTGNSCSATTTTTTTTTSTTTTTTTLAPGCFTYDVINAGGGTAAFNYVACSGSNTASVFLASGASSSVCVDNAKIDSDYFYMVINRTTSSCVGTTTTTSTTTTTTLAPGCFIFNVSCSLSAAFAKTVNYVSCSSAVTSSLSISPGYSASVCVDNYKISTPDPSYISWYNTLISCTGNTTTTSTTTTSTSTTTTTTAAPVVNQKVVVQSCDSTITTPIELVVNGPALSNGNVVHITDGFGDLYCYTITNSNYTGSTLYLRTIDGIYANCGTCPESPATTTTTTTTTACPSSTSYSIVNVSYTNLNTGGTQQVINFNDINGGIGTREVGGGGTTTFQALKHPDDIGVTFNAFGSAGNEISTNSTGSYQYCNSTPYAVTFGSKIRFGTGWPTGLNPLTIKYQNISGSYVTQNLNFYYPSTVTIITRGPIWQADGGGNGCYYNVLSKVPYVPTTTTTTIAPTPSQYAYFGVVTIASGENDTYACTLCRSYQTTPLFWPANQGFGVGTSLFVNSSRTQELTNAIYVANCDKNDPRGAFGAVWIVTSQGTVTGYTGATCGT